MDFAVEGAGREGLDFVIVLRVFLRARCGLRPESERQQNKRQCKSDLRKHRTFSFVFAIPCAPVGARVSYGRWNAKEAKLTRRRKFSCKSFWRLKFVRREAWPISNHARQISDGCLSVTDFRRIDCHWRVVCYNSLETQSSPAAAPRLRFRGIAGGRS